MGENSPLTPVEDLSTPEVEDLPGTVPLLQARWQLRGRDVQVDCHQWDADQTNMNPPLSHVELSGGGVSFLPVRDGVMRVIKRPSRGQSQQARGRLCLGAGMKITQLITIQCVKLLCMRVGFFDETQYRKTRCRRLTSVIHIQIKKVTVR